MPEIYNDPSPMKKENYSVEVNDDAKWIYATNPTLQKLAALTLLKDYSSSLDYASKQLNIPVDEVKKHYRWLTENGILTKQNNSYHMANKNINLIGNHSDDSLPIKSHTIHTTDILNNISKTKNRIFIKGTYSCNKDDLFWLYEEQKKLMENFVNRISHNTNDDLLIGVSLSTANLLEEGGSK